MIFYIDNRRQPEKYFWNSLYRIASQDQIQMILEGFEINIGGVEYKMEIED